MKTSLPSVVGLLFVCVFQGQAQVTDYSFASGFSPGALPLQDTSPAVNGSWHGDIYQNAGGFQEVGGLGLAAGDGIAYSPTFGPVDLTCGYGSFGEISATVSYPGVPNPYYDPSRPEGPFNEPWITPPRTLTQTIENHAAVSINAGLGFTPQSFRLTFYDTSGGSASWSISPISAVGVFGWNYGNEANFTGNLDWTHVNQFSISGDRSAQLFHAAFNELVIMPEPPSWGLAASLSLLGFAIVCRLHRMRTDRKQISSEEFQG